VLEITRGTNLIGQTSLYMSISGVEQMFRHKNLLLHPDPGAKADRLTDTDVPNEPDTVEKNFVFLHGYNVNPTQARGWFADIYKRMYWSGSRAKFYGVTWDGFDSQGLIPGLLDVTINLQTNIVNAFLTAPNLATFLATLTNETVVAAHSLGNMVVLSALNDCTNVNFNISKYFMIDAAVPMEAIEGYQGQTAPMLEEMIHSEWVPYANRLCASEWFGLFPAGDARGTLTWSNRLSNFRNADVYNFYSSGEEVLRAAPGDPPTDLLSAATTIVGNYLFNQVPVASYMWVWQEKGKGRCASDTLLSSTHGGWKFNYHPPYLYVTNGLPVFMSPAQASLVPNSQLMTNAFFDVTSASFGTADTALFGANGSVYAQTNRNRILSDAIPSLTLPVGANAVTNLDVLFGGKRNFDMQGELENGWPPGRARNPAEANKWHHSDVREVAYSFTYKLFNEIVNDGNLK